MWTGCQTKENRLPVSYVLQMSLHNTDVARLWKSSSQSKHGPKHSRLPRGLQQVQQYQGRGWGKPSEHSLRLQPLHFQMGILCVTYGAFFYSLTCRFPPETTHWSWKLSPSIFICKPASTAEVSSTFVFLVVTASPGSRVPPVLFPGGERLRGSGWWWRWWGGTQGLFLPPVLQAEFGGVLACSLSSQCAANNTAASQRKWLMSAESSQGVSTLFYVICHN